MFFEWDEAKNQINIRKHRIDFVDDPEMFNHPMLIRRDKHGVCDEERWVSIGWLKALIGVVVYTERRGEVIRIISARKATKWEARHYDRIIEN
ncbi:BrnT family toxin [Pseudomonas sp. NEEL19]|uniref:BrnT family toxin n=1 Tax=Pseudomonas sp. NEEL19 TaxID=2867409 RepID=UPI0023685749|nr:BrnT family toxin [Pseudomonas sp. NEEL19]WDM60752.1 BrnT family toxin [Pseudomonas sp. NEEL19]